MRNLAQLLADRLILANAKLNVTSKADLGPHGSIRRVGKAQRAYHFRTALDERWWARPSLFAHPTKSRAAVSKDEATGGKARC